MWSFIMSVNKNAIMGLYLFCNLYCICINAVGFLHKTIKAVIDIAYIEKGRIAVMHQHIRPVVSLTFFI